MTTSPTHVVIDGPHPYFDRHGDEFPYWTVSLATDEDDDLKTYEVRNFDRAWDLARNISRDRRIELVNNATPA